MLTPLPFKNDPSGLTDIFRRIAPGSDLHNVLCKYMLTHGVEYVALSVPSVRPWKYIDKPMPRFSQRFPEDYVDNLDSLLAQGDPRVLIINHKSRSARVVKVDSLKAYNSTLLSMFVQSLQQINRKSRILYHMVGVTPPYGIGKFVLAETYQCCFRNLVCKLKVTRGEFEVRLYVRGHVHHTSLLDLSSVSKWLNCEPALVIT